MTPANFRLLHATCACQVSSKSVRGKGANLVHKSCSSPGRDGGFRGVPQGFPQQTRAESAWIDAQRQSVHAGGCLMDAGGTGVHWVCVCLCACGWECLRVHLRACTLETLRVDRPNPRKTEVKPTWEKNLEFQRMGDKARVLDPSRLAQ